MAIENEQTSKIKVLFSLVRTLRTPADMIFFPKFIIQMRKRSPHSHDHMCDDRDLQVATATIKTLLDTK